MKIISRSSLKLPEVEIISFSRFCDQRGFFCEHFRNSDIGNEIVQTGESFSKSNVMRGLHFQWNPHMGKYVRTINGHMIDVVLDIRKNSPNFGEIILIDMPQSNDSKEDRWIWIPPGFAHGNFFLTETRIEYLFTGKHNPNCEISISPFSSDISWRLCDKNLKALFDHFSDSFIMTEKDKNGLSMNDWSKHDGSNNFIYGEMIC